jgi:outer membrane murein-binding lipoprotein Lpp
MKNIFRVACLSTLVLAGCASNNQSNIASTAASNAEIQKQVELVQKKMSACAADINKMDDEKYIDANIIIISANNPNVKKLMNSTEFISDEQAEALKRFKQATLQCRPIAKELPKPEMIAVYEYYYSKVDDVYKDLINKQITIGVANQERQMRLRYTNEKWAQVMKIYKGS